MSKHVISFLSHKGGGGKTTSSHLAAHGLALTGAVVFHAATDSIRTIKASEPRLYNCYPAKTDDELKWTIERFSKVPDSTDRELYLIIDGGANKYKLDEALAPISDLVLIPVKDSSDDYEACVLDLQRLPGSFALRTAWPSGTHLPVAEAELKEELGELHSRLFDHKILNRESTRRISNDKKLGSVKESEEEAIKFALKIRAHLKNMQSS